jgi:hypothetical protein
MNHTFIHPKDDEVISASVFDIHDKFAMMLSSRHGSVTVYMTKVQFRELFRDLEVAHMTEILGVDREAIERDL